MNMDCDILLFWAKYDVNADLLLFIAVIIIYLLFIEKSMNRRIIPLIGQKRIISTYLSNFPWN